MLYHWYELGHAAVRPARVAAGSVRLLLSNPFNPLMHTTLGRSAAAALEVFERTTRRYRKPDFGISSTVVDGEPVSVSEEVVLQRPFCRLIHFKRGIPVTRAKADPRVLLVAPMSGHHATLLRGTVETLLKDHEVFITDWRDARNVPVSEGPFTLDDYVDYIIEHCRLLEGDLHIMAVCQPSVPVLAAVARMEALADPCVPLSLILLGGPVDTRVNPTAVNRLAEERGTDWFARTVVTHVPWPHAGNGRAVYPGFLQLTGFMSMNLDRHVTAHKDLFLHLVEGDGDSAEKHCDFYDEYLAVMDLAAGFYLQTIDTVFVHHKLPRGLMYHRQERVDLAAIKRPALMTVEGEKDDITGIGQCAATLEICSGIPRSRKWHYEQKDVGHYGIFNGSRFRKGIAPRIAQFVREYDGARSVRRSLDCARQMRAEDPRTRHVAEDAGSCQGRSSLRVAELR
ncbi:MAG: polyhydroxyalkanoate depolymerase [Hyphomicrobiaceae bacterium]|nr:MAG: polyhydroxyalkanoate depolymerase [Hyphomicrobiaceae bacterium]